MDLWMKKTLLWQKKTEILFSCKGGAYLKLLVIMLAFMKERESSNCMISFISRLNH